MQPMSIPIVPDTGTAYGRKPATHKAELTEVGAGTPMGELLRRYWHPIGLTRDATVSPSARTFLGISVASPTSPIGCQ